MDKLKPVQVHIRNFQSIDDLSFEVKGFSTLVGKTNIGKSAIMRAISGALLNKPVTNLIRVGAKSCSVQLSSDGWGFLWEKAERGLNRYTIDGKAERLENVGQKQPEPIADMGFSSIRIGDRDLYPWYASQWTPVFLLDEGGPTITQFISEISGLNVLQDAIIISLREKKKVLEELKTTSSEVDRLKEKLKKVDGLDGFIDMTDELDSQAESITEYRKRIKRGEEFYSAITTTTAKIDRLSQIVGVVVPDRCMSDDIKLLLHMYDIWIKLEKAVKLIIPLRNKINLPEAPHDAYRSWSKIQKYAIINKLKSSVQRLEPIGNISVPTKLDAIEIDSIKRAKKIQIEIDRLNRSIHVLDSKIPPLDGPDVTDVIERTLRAKKIMSDINETNHGIARFHEELSKINNELNGVSDELRSIPSCPTCDRPILSVHTHIDLPAL